MTSACNTDRMYYPSTGVPGIANRQELVYNIPEQQQYYEYPVYATGYCSRNVYIVPQGWVQEQISCPGQEPQPQQPQWHDYTQR